jgi:hypothetical protein
VSVYIPNPDVKEFKKRYDDMKSKEKEEEEKKKREQNIPFQSKDTTIKNKHSRRAS